MACQPSPDDLLWAAFDAAATRRGPAPALDFGTQSVSFADLRLLALRAASFLAGLGVATGDIVALQLPNRATTYALMLGCLRLGAIYSPLDPKNPAARTERMLARIKPKLLLTTATAHNPFGQAIPTRTDGTFDSASWPSPLAATLRQPQLSPTHPAYIMFTSGSTGEPKGAVIPQQGVLSLMRWSKALMGDPDAQRFTAINPLHFDNSVFDFYCGLVSGATLVPIETSEEPDPSQWVRRIADARASVMFSVPTLLLLLDKMGALDPSRLPSVRHFVFGGEGFPIDQLRAVHTRFGEQARLINVYGPTETSCICSSQLIDAAALKETPGAYPSLGHMHTDFAHQVLDDNGHAVASGEAGELWIGGPNVGLGYYGNPEETARRFQQDPRQTDYRAIYYRSGDLVRADASGKLWFLGRKDNQIKIAGHRVELEEVDFAVEAQPGVRRSLTVLLSEAATPQLVTAFEADAIIPTETMTAALVARLPVYMRPARLMQVPKLPVNANGKVDRLAVLALARETVNDTQRAATHEAAAAPIPTEALVRRAWSNALGHDTFTNTDSFFDLGGTSLALTRIHAELSAHRPDALSMIDLFAHPTVARIAAFLDGHAAPAQSAASPAASRAERQQAMLAKLRDRSAGAKS